jgi:hypothetical protein
MKIYNKEIDISIVDAKTIGIGDSGLPLLGRFVMIDTRPFIQLLDSQTKETMIETLAHELAHALIYLFAYQDKMKEEQVCDFVGSHYREINRVINEFVGKGEIK